MFYMVLYIGAAKVFPYFFPYALDFSCDWLVLIGTLSDGKLCRLGLFGTLLGWLKWAFHNSNPSFRASASPGIVTVPGLFAVLAGKFCLTFSLIGLKRP